MNKIKRIRAKKSLLIVVLIVSLALSACSVTRGWPGPMIVGDTLYVGSLAGQVIALDPTTGVRKWNWSPETEQSGGFLSCAAAGQLSAGKMYGTPVVANDLVYIGAYDGKVYAITVENGMNRWKQDLESPIVGGVAVDENAVFVGTSEGKFYALNAESGVIKWEYPRGEEIGKIWTTPTVADGVVYFGSLDHKLYALDVGTGEPVWDQPFEAAGAIVTPPLVVDGLVYVGSFDSNFYAVSADSGEQKWVFEEASNWYWARALYYNDTVYAASLDNNVYALDAKSGTQAWNEPLKTGSPVRSSPVVAGGILVVASEEGKVYWRDAETGVTKWAPSVVDAKIFSDLSTDGSVVYVTTEEDKLYTLDSGSGGMLRVDSLAK
ncbi:PQQ-binding-like beta-propeller repeat protein [Chloroflexota bacterium]